MSYSKLSEKIFYELVEVNNFDTTSQKSEQIENEGIITSIDDFMTVLLEACEAYYQTSKIPERDRLILADEFPRELMQRLNEQRNNLDIDANSIKDIRLVTYTADEVPGSLGKHAPDEVRLRNIKPRPDAIYPDPDYDGFSIVRYKKDIEAFIDFQVWGLDSKDVRRRSKLLRDIISSNAWYLKHKGLGEIIWMGSVESEMWDKQNLVKMKKEKYFVKYSEISTTRQKNIEQLVVQVGLA